MLNGDPGDGREDPERLLTDLRSKKMWFLALRESVDPRRRTSIAGAM